MTGGNVVTHPLTGSKTPIIGDIFVRFVNKKTHKLTNLSTFSDVMYIVYNAWGMGGGGIMGGPEPEVEGNLFVYCVQYSGGRGITTPSEWYWMRTLYTLSNA